MFERVSFAYGAEGAEPVLADIDLVVEPGQTVALLGATGAGKSTLVNLVPCFYDVTAGRILLDGVDLRQLQQDALLARIRIVPRDTVLFATRRPTTCVTARLQQALQSLMAGRTSFVFAHRLSTIRNADQVLVIDHGQIVERGFLTAPSPPRAHACMGFTLDFGLRLERLYIAWLGACIRATQSLDESSTLVKSRNQKQERLENKRT